MSAQGPGSQQVMDYLKDHIRVYYLANANTNTPDFREIKVAAIQSASGSFLFGQTSNNRMDVAAQVLMALFSAQKGDTGLQRFVYNQLQKIRKTVTITFVNDIQSDINREYLSQYGFYVFEWNGRTNIWPASYPASSPAIVMGEYFFRGPAHATEILKELLSNLGDGKYGASSAKRPNERIAYTVRYDLPRFTASQLDLWNRADKQQLGLIGSDYDGKDEIGTAPVERQMNLGIGSTQFLNFWYPNTRPQDNKRAYKQTMIGRLKGSEHYENEWVFPDFDIDFYVEPEPPYQFLISESPKPNASFLTTVDALRHIKLPDCPPVFNEVEAEIDVQDIHEKQLVAFFNEEMKTSVYAGFYGPWIYDRGHCDHPEIHPAEQFWWRSVRENVTTLHCNLVCDYSGRYNKMSQFDTDDGLPVMRPWAEAPVKGVFAIPFKVKPGAEKAIFRIIRHDANNLNGNKSVDFNKTRISHFVYKGEKLVSVVEPEDKCMNVVFDNVGISASGEVMGFVVLTTAVGRNTPDNKQEPGHLFFEVKESMVNLARPSAPPGKISVTLESIECLAVDDHNDDEEIYGSVICKAYAVKDTVSFKPERLPFTSNLGSLNCPTGGEENLFCLSCPKWLVFTKGRKSTFGGTLTYNFPADGFLEISGDLDEADSDNCKDFDYLGVPQKKILMTSEIGLQPYRFSQFFASGKTMMKINYVVKRVP